MLLESYHVHLSEKLTRSNYLLTILLIQVVQSIKEVTLESIATKLGMPIKFESRRKKVQRFLSNDEWNLDDVWLSLVIDWIKGSVKQNNIIYLAIDRTKWQSNNILMVSMIWRKRAIPIYWKMLDRQGNSTLENQQLVLTPVFAALSNYSLLVLGDREFCAGRVTRHASVTLANWLREEKVDFCLRLKKNVCIKTEEELWTELKMLGLEPGNSFFNQEVTIRKTAPIEGFNLAGKWLGKYRNITTKEPWYILTSLTDLQAAVDTYAKRFGIEEMFRDFKGGGYNLEKTNLTGDRLSKLLILLSLAYLKSIIQGIHIKSKQVQEYLGRKTESHRKYARHSTFYIGLWGESWVDSMSNNWQIVVELMSLSPHKLPNYQQGLRAMRLILSAL